MSGSLNDCGPFHIFIACNEGSASNSFQHYEQNSIKTQ